VRLERFAFRAMGCPCELRLYGADPARTERIARAAHAEVARLERKYTRYRDDSLTAAIARSAGDPAGIRVDPETAALLDYADTSFRESAGLFDITSGVLRRAWNFKSGRLPSEGEVEAARRLVGWERVRWQRPELVLPQAGMELDFGGYVKEYAADRAAELCRRLGARHGLVDLGGDLAAVGPHADGSPWIVGIRDPRAPGQALASLHLSSGALATSGDYERCMVVDGRRYGHVLDPKTGRPVEGLASVSVAAPQCLVAGTATTVAMLRGEREGPRWLAGLGLPHLWMDRAGAVGGTLAAERRDVASAGATCGSSARSGSGARPDRAA
jgi:thiamine biosynthesis lipoprotein